MLYTCGETLFTYHIYDLHEADAQLNCETVRVIDDWSLQWVVAPHQVIVQSTLVCPLKRNYGRQRNLDSKYTSFRKKKKDSHIFCQFISNLIAKLLFSQTSCCGTNNNYFS